MALSTLFQIAEAVRYIQSVYPAKPQVAIVLGSGLGNLSNEPRKFTLREQEK